MRTRYLFSVPLILLLAASGVAGAAVAPETILVRLHGALHLQTQGDQQAGPATLTLGVKDSADPETSPVLSKITFALSPRIGVHTTGLPQCDLAQLRDTTAAEAMRACGAARVGKGALTRRLISSQSETTILERLIAFNGWRGGKRALFVHTEAVGPLQNRLLFVFAIEGTGSGNAGMTMDGPIPAYVESSEAEWPSRWRVSAFNLSLGRSFAVNGRRKSYLTASCPTEGEAAADFRMAQATLGFGEDRDVITSAVRGECAN